LVEVSATREQLDIAFIDRPLQEDRKDLHQAGERRIGQGELPEKAARSVCLGKVADGVAEIELDRGHEHLP
jgi:hypothetical protein